MRLKNLRAVLLAAALLIGLAVCAGAADAPPAPGTADPGSEALEERPEDGADEAGPQPANGYVYVSAATQSGWLPLPEEDDYTYSLKQILQDGTEAVNLIHLTPDGVYMEDSTCENHDCVHQGIVTLENRKDRILGNMIICLPNQVCLELYTPEEILEMTQAEP